MIVYLGLKNNKKKINFENNYPYREASLKEPMNTTSAHPGKNVKTFPRIFLKRKKVKQWINMFTWQK